MNRDRLKKPRRWLYMLLTIFFLAPTLSMVGFVATSFVPQLQTTAHAVPTKTKAQEESEAKAASEASKLANENKNKTNSSNDKDGKTSSSSSSDSSDSQSVIAQDPTNNQKSQWNVAVGTLSSQAQQASGQNTDTGSSTQPTISDVTQSNNYLNVWGFMGPANTDVWSKNDNSSWATSFQSLIPNRKTASSYKVATKDQAAYQVAARFAYAMQSSGLDRPVKAGFDKVSGLQIMGGWVLQAAFYILTFANGMFRVLIRILEDINPLHWVIVAAESNTSSAANAANMHGLTYIDGGPNAQVSGAAKALQPLSDAVLTYYSWFTSWGWGIMLVFLVGGIGMAALGISIGPSGGFVGQGRAASAALVTFFKRLFVFVMVPIFAASLYDMALTSLENTFSNENGDITAYAVYGSFVDYGDWVVNSRLAIPASVGNGTGLDGSFNSTANAPLSHQDIVAINFMGAGQPIVNLYGYLFEHGNSGFDTNSDAGVALGNQANDLSAQPNSTLTVASSGASSNSSSVYSTADQDEQDAMSGLSLLRGWTQGNTMTAATYASTQSRQILAQANGGKGSTDSSQLATELETSKYNQNGLNLYPGDPTHTIYNGDDTKGGSSISVDKAYDQQYYQASVDAMNSSTSLQLPSGNPYSAGSSPVNSGGLSTLGLYNYMLTTATDTGMTIAATDNLADDISLPSHYTVNLVGTGLTATGNLMWSIGLMGGLAILVAGYGFEILKSLIHGIPATIFALFQTGFASIKGGVQLISVTVGIILGTAGSAFLYRFAQIAFISLAEYSDAVVHGYLFQSIMTNILTVGHHFSVGGLDGAPAADSMTGAMNIIYGIFLLFVAFMLLRYRGYILSSISSLIEETVNKILASLGSVSGTGSAGTRGAISQNTNSTNTWGNTASSIITRGGMGALMAGGAASGLAGLGKAVKGAGKGAKGVGGTGKNNLGGTNKAAAAGRGTSAGKTGNASALMGNKGAGNAASALGRQNAQRQGSQLGTQGKGINDASQHAAAGQGGVHSQMGQFGMGQGSSLQGQGQGQTQNQGQGQGQNAQVAGSMNGNSSDHQGMSSNNYGNDTNGQQNGLNDLNGQNSDLGQSNGDSTTIGGDTTSQNLGQDQSGINNNGFSQDGTTDTNQTNQNAGNQLMNENSSQNLSNQGDSRQGDLRQLSNEPSALGQNGGDTRQTNQNHAQNLSTNNNGSQRMSDLTNNNEQLGTGLGNGVTNNNAENNSSQIGQSSPNALGQSVDNTNLNQNDLQTSQGGIGDTNMNNNTLGDNGNGTLGNDNGLNQNDNSQINQTTGGMNSNDLTNNSNMLGQANNGMNDAGSSINNNDAGTNVNDNNSTSLQGDMSNTNLGSTNDTPNQFGNQAGTNINNTDSNLTQGGMSSTNLGNTNETPNALGGNNSGATGDSTNVNNNDSRLNQGGTNTSTFGNGNQTPNALGGNANATGRTGAGNVNNTNLQNATNQNGMSNISGDNLNNNAGDTNTNTQGSTIGAVGNDTVGVNGADGSQLGGNVGNSSLNNSEINNGGTTTNDNGIGNTTNTSTLGNTTTNGAGNGISGLNGNDGQATSIGGDSSSIGQGNTGSTLGTVGNQGVNGMNGTGNGNSVNNVNSQSLGGQSIGQNNNATNLGNSNVNGNRLGGNSNISNTNGDQVNSSIGAGQNNVENGLAGTNATGDQNVNNQTLGGNMDNSNNLGDTQNGNIANNMDGASVNGNQTVNGQQNISGTQNGTVANNLNTTDNNSINSVGQNGLAQNGTSAINNNNNNVMNGIQQSSQLGQSMGDAGSIGQTGNQDADTIGQMPQTDTNNTGMVSNNPGASLGQTESMGTTNSIGTPNDVGQTQTQNGIQSTGNETPNTIGTPNPQVRTMGQTTQTPVGMNGLGGVSNSPLAAYNAQPITGGMDQAGWVSGDTANLSVGSVNNAMNSVYNAQQNVAQATQQYGAGSPQVQAAQGALQTAQQGAISSGLASNVVSNPQAVEAAHAKIDTAENNIQSGSFNAGGFSNGGSTGNQSAKQGGNSGKRNIGI